MDASGLHIERESFSCSICLDLLKDPVSIPCGHSYCMSCIKTHWDGEVEKKSYSCPQCRHRFTLRPVLVKNTMLSVLMEGLKKSGAPAAPAAPLPPSSAADGHVFCDLCTGTKVKAVKSCLQCLVSYCKEHLQPHYDVPALKKHKLLEPTDNLQENMCSVHDEVMKMFCRTDQQCICYLCSMDQHKGHHTVTAAAERTEKQRELQAYQQNILQRICHKEKHLDGLHRHLEDSSRSANAAVKFSDGSLKDLGHLLEKRMSLVKQQVRSQQEAEEHRVNEVQDKIQQEISKLKTKLTDLDTLSHSEDHVHFLHRFASLSKVSEPSEPVNRDLSPPPFQDIVTAAVSKLRSIIQETSVLNPPAASNKTQVKTAKTDGLPSAPTVTSQQREQPLQEDVPPSQSSEEVRSHQDRKDFLEEKFRLFPKGYFSIPMASVEPAASLPPAASNKPPVKSVLPAEPTAASQQTEQQPLPLQEDVPPSQSSHCVEQYYKVLPSGHYRISVYPDKKVAELVPPQSSTNAAQALTSEYQKMKKHALKITWDPRSLNDHLELSDDKLSVTVLEHSKDYDYHKMRFEFLPQAVSYEYLKGQCYFEVKLFPYYNTTFNVAVAYNNMRRDHFNNTCRFGMNEKSWALECQHHQCLFVHNGKKIRIPVAGDLVGVFVDHEAGILSFYRQSSTELDTLCDPIHTVKTTFAKPLVAGIGINCMKAKVDFCQRMFAV